MERGTSKKRPSDTMRGMLHSNYNIDIYNIKEIMNDIKYPWF